MAATVVGPVVRIEIREGAGDCDCPQRQPQSLGASGRLKSGCFAEIADSLRRNARRRQLLRRYLAWSHGLRFDNRRIQGRAHRRDNGGRETPHASGKQLDHLHPDATHTQSS